MDRTVASRLASATGRELGLTVPVLVRSGAELAAVIDGSPYADRQDDPTRLLVAFLATAPTKAKVAALTVPGTENVEFTVAGREVQLHFPDGGYGRSKFTNAYAASAPAGRAARAGGPGTSRADRPSARALRAFP